MYVDDHEGCSTDRWLERPDVTQIDDRLNRCGPPHSHCFERIFPPFDIIKTSIHCMTMCPLCVARSMVVGSLIVFAVSLLIGAIGIYTGARVVADVDSYPYAIIAALIGAIVWGLSGFLFGWIPLLGPILVFIAYLAVINWRYPGGWVMRCSSRSLPGSSCLQYSMCSPWSASSGSTRLASLVRKHL
jgi:hypothetical protein